MGEGRGTSKEGMAEEGSSKGNQDGEAIRLDRLVPNTSIDIVEHSDAA